MIHIRDPAELERKIQQIKADDNTHFHVVSDFDKTLTPAFINGEKAETAIGQLRANGYLSPEYVKEAYALKDHYHAIEIDETIPIEERTKKMQEWWTKHLEAMIQYGLTKDVLDDIIQKRRIKPRPGSLEFYDILHKHNVPLLIFSAGIGSLIEGFLDQEGRNYQNIHVISNFYDFDETGKCKGYKGPIIHVFNKNEGQIKNARSYEDIKHRRNIMLLGDRIADINMSDGLGHDTVISVGFLNEKPELLNAYQQTFDVVITDDGPMDYVNDLLKKIL